ncbi:DUF5336 domain-containing protein [Rhodococcus marinonascens]|uniref:DUF5336 domain-containing protein n=1 Tax=Rhodococcus marinonascens TaxID=38311 RepID=UPI0009335174|nr:DUF5336 domain-containing protein [Rhodococcus marinonascens]
MTNTTEPGSYGVSQQFPAQSTQPHPQQSSQGLWQQGFPQPTYAARIAGVGGGLPFFLALCVAGLGVVNFLLGFAPFAKADLDAATDGIFGGDSMAFFDNAALGAGIAGIAFLLLAGMITAVGLLPRQRSNAGLAAATAVTGFVTVLFTLIGLTPGLEAGVGLILVLVFGFLQAAAAVAVVLLGTADFTQSALAGVYPVPGHAPGQSAAPGMSAQSQVSATTPQPGERHDENPGHVPTH